MSEVFLYDDLALTGATLDPATDEGLLPFLVPDEDAEDDSEPYAEAEAEEGEAAADTDGVFNAAFGVEAAAETDAEDVSVA